LATWLQTIRVTASGLRRKRRNLLHRLDLAKDDVFDQVQVKSVVF